MAKNPKLEKFSKKWQGKKVLIMGLGLHGGGAGTARFFAKMSAKVLVADLKTEKELKPSLEKLKEFQNIEYHLGYHQNQDFKTSDLIIKNPAVPKNSPYLKIARQAKVPIETDISIFFKLCPAPIIGITGTKGKSTTAALTYALLKTTYPTHLAGNIRCSVLEELPLIQPQDKVILELSSWQLEDLAPHQVSPHLAVITRLDQDHLNRHPSLADYYEAKKVIFKYQTKNDHLFLNANDPCQLAWADQAPGQVHFYQSDDSWLKYLKLPGFHNQENAAAALAVAKHLKIPKVKIKIGFQNFETLEGRLQLVGVKKRVRFYNDTTATTPLATLRALQAFQKPVILIAGGQDKNLNYQGLAQALSSRVKTLILLPGSASAKIKAALAPLKAKDLKLLEVKNMAQAVQGALRAAQPGDTILLSPAAASFNQYPHEFARGEDFKQQIAKLP